MANTDLDFTALFAGTAAQQGEPGTKDKGTVPKPTGKPRESVEGQQAPTLFLQAQREKEAQDKALDVYREYQDNIKLCEGLKTNILKGIMEGTDVYTLLYWALQAVSKTTHDTVFLDQAWRDVNIIYGWVLREPGPLQQEIEGAKERLQKIRERAEIEPEAGARSRMQAAVKAHEALIARLEGQTESNGSRLKVEHLRLDTDKGEFVPIEGE